MILQYKIVILDLLWLTSLLARLQIPNPSQQNPIYDDMGRPVVFLYLDATFNLMSTKGSP